MWTAFDGWLTAFNLCPASPCFFSHCQKISRLLLTQCWELAASGWRLWWDLGNNCYSRLRMEMRMTSDWQNRLLGRLSYYTVSRSSSGEGKTMWCTDMLNGHRPVYYGFEKWLWRRFSWWWKTGLGHPLRLSGRNSQVWFHLVSFEDAWKRTKRNYKYTNNLFSCFIRSFLGILLKYYLAGRGKWII